MNNAGQEEHYVCLSLALSAGDKALMVSTQESKILFVGLQLGYWLDICETRFDWVIHALALIKLQKGIH